MAIDLRAPRRGSRLRVAPPAIRADGLDLWGSLLGEGRVETVRPAPSLSRHADAVERIRHYRRRQQLARYRRFGAGALWVGCSLALMTLATAGFVGLR